MELDDINRFVDMKTDLFRFKRLLARTKGAIEDFKFHYPKEVHFDGILKEMEACGVKGTFDSGKEYDEFVWGKKC
jgi:hypothetical protein